MPHCRYILLVEFMNDDELISAIATIEKNLPDYDYASRPLNISMPGQKGSYKFLAFKGLTPVANFPKFSEAVFKLQQKIHIVRMTPGYVSLTNVVSASPNTIPGSILGERKFYYKLQLVFSEKTLAPYALTDELFKDKRSVLYLNDVWQLVRGARH